MTVAEQIAALKAPFHPSEIDWRIGSCGKKKDGGWWALALAYIDGRAVQDRLDAVVGCENWKPEYREWTIGTPGVLCGLSLRLDGEWIIKWDGADQPDTEPMKGGLSNALKRAAVPWGIGRYLYALPKTYADIRDDGAMHAELKIKKTGESAWVNWNPPTLPDWAIPEGAPRAASKAAPEPNYTPKTVPVAHPSPEDKKAMAAAKPAKRGPVPICPTCEGAMWDNRDKKASGEYKAKSPDFTCKDKDCKNEKGFRSGAWEEEGAKPVAATVAKSESFDDFPAALDDEQDSTSPF